MNRRTVLRNSTLALLGSLTTPALRGQSQNQAEDGDQLTIRDVEIWKLHGRVEGMAKEYQGVINPLQLYPNYHNGLVDKVQNPKQQSWDYSANYLRILTENGPDGVYGPIDNETISVITWQLKPFLKGKNALATELIWDQMYRLNRHGRTGHFMMGISAVDNALWDLKGKYYEAPVYQLLGGPTRPKVPVYASMLGNSVQPEYIKDTARSYKEMGFQYQKWFMPYGPGQGTSGLNFNIEMVKNLREALGEDYEIMFDAFSGWDLLYATQWAQAVEQYRPRWIEEAFAMDKMSSFRALREKTTIPVATGEHFYNRWEVKRFLTADAINVVQADPEWCGGTSELVKICTLASAFDVQVIPHGHNLHAALHVVASQSPMTCPFGEYLYNKMQTYNHFHQHALFPEAGEIRLPDVPGFGLDWDEDKILKKELISAE